MPTRPLGLGPWADGSRVKLQLGPSPTVLVPLPVQALPVPAGLCMSSSRAFHEVVTWGVGGGLTVPGKSWTMSNMVEGTLLASQIIGAIANKLLNANTASRVDNILPSGTRM